MNVFTFISIIDPFYVSFSCPPALSHFITVLCTPGKFAASGQRTCGTCTAGKEQLKAGTGCADCIVGQFSAVETDSKCQECPQGFFQSKKGTPYCLPCLPGQFQVLRGKSSCDVCPTNTKSTDANSTNCDSCEVGKKSTPGSAKCIPCAAGQAGTGENGACVDCTKGQYRSSGMIDDLTQCTSCNIGQYQDTSGQASCLPCIPGSYNDEFGQFECKVCRENTNSESSNATECNVCEIGTISESGSAKCQACGAGTYGNGCQKCKVGYARSSTDPDTTQCKICKLGETTSVVGSSSCEKCDVGQYGSITGTCSSCPSGKFQDGKGATECKTCVNGEVTLTKSSCLNCDAGKYGMFNTSGVFCVDCKQGRFQGLKGQGECNTCSGGTVTNNQRTGCTLPPWGECKIGEYLNDGPLEKSDWECLRCPDGAECETLPVPTLSILQNQPGFWRIPSIYYDQPMQPRVEYILCNFPDRCSSTYNFSLSCQQRGTEGPMCAVCSDHFNLDSKGICTECSDSVLATRMILCLIVLVLFMLCLLFIQRKFAHLSRKYRDMKKDIFRLVIIFINFSQIGSSMPSVFKIRWPPNYLELINRLDYIFNFNILQLSGVPCATKINYGSRLVFMAVLPLLVLFIVVLVDFWLRSRRRAAITMAALVHGGSDYNAAKLLHSSLMRVFEMVDHDGSDSLDAEEMMQLFQHVGKHMKRKDVRKLIRKWENNSNAKELTRDVFTANMMMGDDDNNNNNRISTFLTKQQEENVLEWAESSATGFTRTISLIGEVMFVIHSPVSNVAFQWNSLQLIGDRHFLKADPGIQHGTEEWSGKLWLSLFILLFFTFGFPLMLILLLAKYRKTLWTIETKGRLGWMYDRYNFGAEWWGLHECFRKLILTGMLIFIEQLETRIVCASIVSLFAIVNLSYNKPMRNMTVFWVSEISLLMTSIRYIMASYLIIKQEKGYVPKAGDTSDMVLVVLEVSTWCMFLGGIILCIVMGLKTTTRKDIHQAVEEENDDHRMKHTNSLLSARTVSEAVVHHQVVNLQQQQIEHREKFQSKLMMREKQADLRVHARLKERNKKKRHPPRHQTKAPHKQSSAVEVVPMPMSKPMATQKKKKSTDRSEQRAVKRQQVMRLKAQIAQMKKVQQKRMREKKEAEDLALEWGFDSD